MSQQSGQSTKSAFFDLTVDGVGYLNRVRAVKPKKGAEFLACTVAAMRAFQPFRSADGSAPAGAKYPVPSPAPYSVSFHDCFCTPARSPYGLSTR